MGNKTTNHNEVIISGLEELANDWWEDTDLFKIAGRVSISPSQCWLCKDFDFRNRLSDEQL
jgi:hypothetical protein